MTNLMQKLIPTFTEDQLTAIIQEGYPQTAVRYGGIKGVTVDNKDNIGQVIFYCVFCDTDTDQYTRGTIYVDFNAEKGRYVAEF